ncbi:MGH1-like glycoside hydrolase domain-containing protein [Acidicapsa acidisoli]|uniref:MGH1-like glycoside hydrolase domain-containing protein n=1 Tax=Acidicapsa acidisoli TaxID=1615681 RepID=UPI0021DF7652|nr:trehalase family glycosidase [Acidicapsa acidisoli]
MKTAIKAIAVAAPYLISCLLLGYGPYCALAQAVNAVTTNKTSRSAGGPGSARPASKSYQQVQQRLAQGWNTWDVNSVTTQVLLPEGLAIHVGLKHNSTEYGDAFLKDVLIGRLTPGAEQVVPGAHSWDGSYTDLQISWRGHMLSIQSARDGSDLVLLATPLTVAAKSALPPTIVFSVDFLWNRSGTALKRPGFIQTQGTSGVIPVYCTCSDTEVKSDSEYLDIPMGGPFFASDLVQPVGLSTGKRRTLSEIEALIAQQKEAYRQSISMAGSNAPIIDAIETTLGWDTIYEPSRQRVISPVSRVWSVDWGGYVIFDWDTFFAATMAGIGDRDLAYADAIETLRESTDKGFVPNYARAGGWSSFDRSEPPVGSITVLGLYKKFNDRWFIEEAFEPLLRWNRWWSEHRDIQGYLAWGSDGDNKPGNLDDGARGKRAGAILESGLDNSPMYDSTTYNFQSHLLEYADVGLMGMYIADCDALAEIADALDKPAEAKELKERGAHYRTSLATLWDDQAGIFLNKDLHTGQFNTRLSPTNFYPMLAHAATPEQAKAMIEKHMLNTNEFWGEWVIPSIERDDPAFNDQNYWRGRIWGPMNYLVYLGLCNYDNATVRTEFARKSYSLFLKEWSEKGHVHENYNAMLGTGDDVSNSDRFYHWGALLGYVEYLEQDKAGGSLKPGK